MPLDQRGFLEEDIAREEKEVAEREASGVVPKIPKWVPTNTPGYKPKYEYIPPKTYTPKKSTYTTKKGDTYPSVAEITGRAPADIVNAPGNPKNLRPGQVINIPAITGQNTAGVPPAQQYPVQTINQTRYADWRKMEVQAQNDAWYISHADEISQAAAGLSPFARGPKADKIRAQMKALQQAYERTGTTGGRLMRDTAVGQAITSVGNWFVGGVKGELPSQQPLPPQPTTQAELDERAAYNQGLTGKGMLQTFSNFFNRQFSGFAPDYVPTTPETVGDVRQQQAIAKRQQAMQDYYGTPVNPLEGTSVIPDTRFDKPQFTKNADGTTTVADIPTAADVGGEQQAADLGAEIIETDYRGPNGTLNAPDGYVFYNGYMIRRDKFLDYLNSDAYNRDADYWQRQLFVRGMTKDIEAVMWALNKGDRDMLPISLTPRHVENLDVVFGKDITGESPAEINAYVRDVLGYRWDANQQVWVKEKWGGTPSAATGGGGAGYGTSRSRGRRSGGGRGARGSADEWSGAVDYGVDQSPVRPGFDQRYLNVGPGHLPVHWRL